MTCFQNLWGDNQIGANVKIGAFCEIGNAKIGNNCKIQAFTFICNGVELEDDVFIGPHVCFTNDRRPKATGDWTLTKTLVKKGASIGANSTIICGVTIGEGALIGAGSVVTKNVPKGEVWVGNPARKLR